MLIKQRRLPEERRQYEINRIKQERKRVEREEWVYNLVQSKRMLKDRDDVVDGLINAKKAKTLLENKLFVLSDPEFLQLAKDVRDAALQLLAVKSKKTKMRVASMLPLLSQISSVEYVTLLEEEERLKHVGINLEKKFKAICKEKRFSINVSPLPSTIIIR